MDKLDKFLQDNKADLDPELPDGLWDKIDTDLGEEGIQSGTRKKRGWVRPLSIAAGLAVLITAGVWVMNSGEDKADGQTAVIEQEDPEPELEEVHNLGDISPEYAEIEIHYVNQVNDRMNELNQLSPDPELMETIHELEEEYEYLKAELGTGGDDEQIVEAMIETYRLKLRVLEDILDHLKTDSDETVVEVGV